MPVKPKQTNHQALLIPKKSENLSKYMLKPYKMQKKTKETKLACGFRVVAFLHLDARFTDLQQMTIMLFGIVWVMLRSIQGLLDTWRCVRVDRSRRQHWDMMPSCR